MKKVGKLSNSLLYPPTPWPYHMYVYVALPKKKTFCLLLVFEVPVLCIFVLFCCRITQNCHDEASRFVRMMATNGCNYLVEDDFMPLIQVRTYVQCVCTYTGRLQLNTGD